MTLSMDLCKDLLWFLAVFIGSLIILPAPVVKFAFPRRNWLECVAIGFMMALAIVTTLGYIQMTWFELNIYPMVLAYLILITILMATAVVVRKLLGKVLVWKETNKQSWIPILTIIAAVCIGSYLRFLYPMGHTALLGADPYIHLAWTKYHITGIEPSLGFEFQDQAFYPRGLHILVFFLSETSNTSIFFVFRFLGACLGILSIVFSFMFIRKFVNTPVASVSALLYAGLPMFDRWIERQAETIPETLGITLIPICLYLANEIMTESRGPKIRMRTVGLFILSVVTLAFAHHLSVLFLLLGLFILFYYHLYYYGHAIPAQRIVLIFFLTIFFCIYFIILYNSFFETTYSINLNGILLPKTFFFTPKVAVMLALFGMLFWIGANNGTKEYFFLGGIGLLLQFIHITGMLVPMDFVGREGFFNAMVASWAAGALVYEFMTRQNLKWMASKMKGGLSLKLLDWILDRIMAHSRFIHYLLLGAAFITYIIFVTISPGIVLTGVLFLSIMIAGLFVGTELLERGMGNRAVGRSKQALSGRGETKITEQTSFHILVIGVIIITTMVPAQTMDKYYVYGYEENVTSALRIQDDFQGRLDQLVVYSEMETPTINREGAIMETEADHREIWTLIRTPPEIWVPDTNYTFIFIETDPFPEVKAYESNYNDLRIVHMRQAQEWVDRYASLDRQDSYITPYMDEGHMMVYLIERV